MLSSKCIYSWNFDEGLKLNGAMLLSILIKYKIWRRKYMFLTFLASFTKMQNIFQLICPVKNYVRRQILQFITNCNTLFKIRRFFFAWHFWVRVIFIWNALNTFRYSKELQMPPPLKYNILKFQVEIRGDYWQVSSASSKFFVQIFLDC